MGEKVEKGARAAESDKSPRKAMRLEMREDVILISSSSSSSDEGCRHFRANKEDTEMLLVQIESLKCGPAAPACEGCVLEPFGVSGAGNGLIMVCSQCVRCFCTGADTMEDKPYGHSGLHAHQECHPVALWIDKPKAGFCFSCEHGIYVATPAYDSESEGMSSVDSETMSPEMKPDGRGYVVRGIPNVGNTCYMNAMVQCLLVLEKLRTWMLGTDTPTGPIGMALKMLFEDTRAGNPAGGMLNPFVLLRSVRALDSKYEGCTMHDSHELLGYLRNGLNEELKRPPYMREGVPTVVDSIFQGQQLSTLTTNCCQSDSVSGITFYDLPLPLPLPKMEHPTRSIASPQLKWARRSQRKPAAAKQLFPIFVESDSEPDAGDSHIPGTVLEPEPLEVDYTEAEQVPQKTLDVLPLRAIPFLPDDPFDIKVEEMYMPMADSHCPEDTCLPLLVSPVREKNASTASGSDVEDNACVVDLSNQPEVTTDAKKDTYAVQSTSESKGKTLVSDTVYDEKVGDRNSLTSIKDCLTLYFKKEVVALRCEKCSKDPEQSNTTGSKDGGPTVASTDENTSVDREQAEPSDRNAGQNKQPSDLNSSVVECISSIRQPYDSDAQLRVIHTEGGITEALGASFPEKDSASCSTENKESDCYGKAEEKIDLSSVQDSQIASTPNLDSKKQTEPNSAHLVGENQNEQKDTSGHADKTVVISKLPPVLTIQLMRFDRINNISIKKPGHVSFEENLDMGQFVDPRSEDKDNARYGLVGVVEHIGGTTDVGHYIAYVRGSRSGSHQQSSSGSPWFCANDANVRQVSLEEVLKREAFVLFYERMEGQGTSGNMSR